MTMLGLRLYFAHKRGCKFLIEQPVSSETSLQHRHCLFSLLLKKLWLHCHTKFSNSHVSAWSCRWKNEVLWYFRPMRQFLQFTGARRVAFPMGSYGSPSIKMTVFLVSFGYILCIFFLFGTPAQSNFTLLLS